VDPARIESCYSPSFGSTPFNKVCYPFHRSNTQPVGALLGSITGKYATIDLAEASDRVSSELVRLLFPEPLSSALMNSRSLSTVLPSGEVIMLNKYAPMGSALCFPVMATIIWALLYVGLPGADVPFAFKDRRYVRNDASNLRGREDILVYGDDVIVATAQAEHAITILETFGFRANRNKCCTSGFFRESCGMDAYRGTCVTPVRLRTVWRDHLDPDVYMSYIALANNLHEQKYWEAYDEVVSLLLGLYQVIPERDMFDPGWEHKMHPYQGMTVPSLPVIPEANRPRRSRTNKRLQKREWYVWDVKTPRYVEELPGWNKLLRFFAETSNQTPFSPWEVTTCEPRRGSVMEACTSLCTPPFSVSEYTKRKASCLVKRWR